MSHFRNALDQRLLDGGGDRGLPKDLDAHSFLAQPPEQPRFDSRRDDDPVIGLLLVQHFRIAVQRGEQLAVAERYPDPGERP